MNTWAFQGVFLFLQSCENYRPHNAPLPPHPLGLQVALLLQLLAVADLGLDEVLFGGGQEEPLGIHGADDVVPDGAPLAVIPTHPTGQVLLYHLGRQAPRQPTHIETVGFWRYG